MWPPQMPIEDWIMLALHIVVGVIVFVILRRRGRIANQTMTAFDPSGEGEVGTSDR